jgi:hypothetical protein
MYKSEIHASQFMVGWFDKFSSDWGYMWNNEGSASSIQIFPSYASALHYAQDVASVVTNSGRKYIVFAVAAVVESTPVSNVTVNTTYRL